MADGDERLDLGIEGLGPAEHIGRGGFADVYRAEQYSLRRTVAVKVLRAQASDPEAEARFRRECHAIGAVSDHPHIVGVHQGGFTRNGRAYLVMEYQPGGSLAERLARSGPLPVEEAVATAAKIARALAVAHRAGVLHRDVKPANILISAYGEPALADFGIARIEGGHQTSTGVVTASIVHAAPEVLEGHVPAGTADIYSLGSSLYELLTGRAPYHDPTDESVWPLMKRILSQPMPDPGRSGLSPALGRVILRATDRDPGSRHADADALAADLEALLDDPAALDCRPVTGGAPPVDPDATQAIDDPVLGAVVGAPVPLASRPDLTALRPDVASGTSAGTRAYPVAGPAGQAWAPGPQAAPPAPGRGGGLRPTSDRDGAPIGPLVAAAVVAAVLAAAVWLLLLPALGDGTGTDTGASGPVAAVTGADSGPLEAGAAHAVTVEGLAADTETRLLLDGAPVDGTSAVGAVPDLVAPAGRHRLEVELTTPAGVVTSAPVEFFATTPPEAGYRAHLARVPAVAERWPEVLAAHDALAAEGHGPLEVLASDEVADLAGGVWFVAVAGFGDDPGAADAYCRDHGLAVPERCWAGPVAAAAGS